MTEKTNFQESQNSLGFIEAMPKPSEKELQEYYEQKYFQNSSGPYSLEYLPEELSWFKNIAKVAKRTAETLNLNKYLLDLGCGEGYFTSYFSESGWQISCCDFSDFALKTHNPKLLPFFKSGDIYELCNYYAQNDEDFGLINLQNVLEHVLDPISLLENIKPILKNNHSALRVKVPNDYSDFQKQLIESGNTENTWFNPPEHLSYFNIDGLKKTLEHCGYKIVSLQATFPIELFLANPHSNYWQKRELGKGAHSTRILCENFLIDKNVDDYINYSEAAARLGFGRELIAYITLG